jgi:hypothetical protein
VLLEVSALRPSLDQLRERPTRQDLAMLVHQTKGTTLHLQAGCRWIQWSRQDPSVQPWMLMFPVYVPLDYSIGAPFLAPL